ncbi:MAG: hypothetical protein ACM3VS_16520 [Candidatus Dadabacteria bacterium]
MRAATVQEIKKELQDKGKQELVEICLRLARYKKDNKELLSFLLFESNDLEGYIQNVRMELDEGFRDMNTTNIYFAKKTIRKLLRNANKYIRYSGSKLAEVEILLHFLTNLRGSRLPWQKTRATSNIYENQFNKIKVALAAMHEDLQHDYLRELQRLEL